MKITAYRCPECGQATYLYTLGCAAFHDAEGSIPIEQFHFLRRVTSLPETVLKLLKAKCPSYYLDDGEDGEPPYLMNHCPCGAKLDDDFVNGDVGSTFWPDTPQGYRHFKLFRLLIYEDIPVQCGYMIGGGEYLDYANAERW